MVMRKFISTATAVVLAVSCFIMPSQAKAEELMDVKFVFGSESASEGIAVNDDCAYGQQENGYTYGFINVNETSVMNDIRFDGFSDDIITYIKNGKFGDTSYVTADYSKYDEETLDTFGDGVMPVRFAVSAQPHRYYTVSATVVNTSETESTEVSLFSENRYMILYNHILEPGEKLTKTWNINLEGQYYNSTGAYTNDAINVAVAGKNVGLADITIKQHEKMGKTIWLCTDSTGDNSSASVPYFGLRGKCGVGQAFPKYFNPEIAVNNQGEGGLTSADTNHVNNALKYMQEGDYLYVQYGFNGETTESLVKNLPRYYNAVKEKGGKLIIASTTERQNSSFWNSDTNKWEASNAAIAAAGKKYVEDMIAQGADDIAFIDLNTAFSNWMNTESENIMKQRQRLGFGDTKPTRLAMNYYFGYDRDSGVDSVHINDAGADNAAYLVMEEIKNTVGIESLDTDREIVKITASYREDGSLNDVKFEEIMSNEATEPINTAESKTFYWESIESMKPYDISPDVEMNDIVEARVLYELMQNSPNEKPYTMPDEFVAKGWVPNDSYPYPLPGNVEYEYPTIVKSVNIEDNAVSDIEVMVQGNMQYYAQGAVDILDADGNLVKTVYSTSTDINPLIDHIDNTACSCGEIYTMYFNKAETVLSDGESIRAYTVALPSGADAPTDEKYSSYYIPEEIETILLFEDFTDGIDGWNTGGSSAVKETSAVEKNGRSAIKLTTNGSGTYNVFKRFNDNIAVSNGKIKLHFMMNYVYGNFTIKLTNSSKTGSYIEGMKNLNIIDGVVSFEDGTKVGALKTNKWTDIECVVDMINGTQTVSIAGGTPVTVDIEKLKSENNDSANSILPIRGLAVAYMSTGSTIPSYSFETYLSEVEVSLLKAEIPKFIVTADIHEDCKDLGTVTGSGEYDMNSTAVLTPTAADGYECIGWYNEDGECVSEEAIYTLRVRSDKTVYAKFAKKSVLDEIESFTEDFEGDANIFAVNPNKNVSSFSGSGSSADIKDGITLIDTSGKSGSVFGNILGISGGNSVEAVLTENLILEDGKNFYLDFDCFYGYYGTSCNSVVSLKDSAGNSLIEYTWNSKTSNVTDVKIGGETPSDFAAFRFKSMYSSSSGVKNWGSNPYSLTNADYTPHVTITISSDANVSINFTVPTEDISVTYTGVLNDDFDISALTIATSDRLNADNAVGYDNFVQVVE